MTAIGRLPVVVILGATGTGKSKLAIDLAAKFGGEIISADSMQVYKGLDILTNKVTEEDIIRIPHHMIGIVNHSEKFDVTCFRNRTLPLIESIWKEGKMPFIVGGTNYYIESILWKVLIDKKTASISTAESFVGKRKHTESAESDANFQDNEILKFAFSRKGIFKESDLHWDSDQLHQALKEIDPERAMRLHPKDKRKVIRSIQVRFQTGRKHSDLIAEQCNIQTDMISKPLVEDGDSQKDQSHLSVAKKSLGGPLRFHDCLCLWIQAPQDILDLRIEKRVDEMVQKGLRKELDDYMDILRKENSALNYEEGLLQSIGFKEFNQYIQISPGERLTEQANQLFLEGTERLKTVTKQYARKQHKWIKQRFLRPDRRQVPPVYWLDGSLANSADWEKNVTAVGESILEAHLNKRFDFPILRERKVSWIENDTETDLITRSCEICENRFFIGTLQWEQHMQSAKHRKMLKRKTRLELSQSQEMEKALKY